MKTESGAAVLPNAKVHLCNRIDLFRSKMIWRLFIPLWFFCDSSPAVKCTAPQIENGFVPGKVQEYKEHDILSYQCNPRYKYAEARPSACTKVGFRAEWSPRPACECKSSSHLSSCEHKRRALWTACRFPWAYYKSLYDSLRCSD